MNNQRLISFDIQADFGFFKKPDYNDGVLLTYNMLHKPALEKPRDFDPFGHAGFAHLWLQYD